MTLHDTYYNVQPVTGMQKQAVSVRNLRAAANGVQYAAKQVPLIFSRVKRFFTGEPPTKVVNSEQALSHAANNTSTHLSPLKHSIRTAGKAGTALALGDTALRLYDDSQWRERQLPDELKQDGVFGYYTNTNIPGLLRTVMGLRDLSNMMVNEDYTPSPLGVATLTSDAALLRGPAGIALNGVKPLVWYGSRGVRNNLNPISAYKNLGNVALDVADDNGVQALIPSRRTLLFASQLPYLKNYDNFDDPYMSGTFYSALQDMLSNSYDINGVPGAAKTAVDIGKILFRPDSYNGELPQQSSKPINLPRVRFNGQIRARRTHN